MWSRTLTAAMFLVVTCTVGYAQREESFQRPHVQTFDLGTFAPGMDSFAGSINNRGEIVGTAVEGNQGNAFLWTPRRGFRLIREFANANDINNLGQVVGAIMEDVNHRGPMLWDLKLGVVPLGPIVNNIDSAQDINDRGDIVGVSRVSSGELHVMLWRVTPGRFGTRDRYDDSEEGREPF